MMYFGIGFGIWEMLIILVIVLILFGAGKLPKVMSQLGKGTKAFKDGMRVGDGAEGDEPAQIDVTPDDVADAEVIEVESKDSSAE